MRRSSPLATGVELAAYGEAAVRVVAAYAEAEVTEIDDGWEQRWREFHHAVRIGPLWIGPPWQEPRNRTPSRS